MIRELYYFLAAIMYKRRVGTLGKQTKLRFGGRILSGQYVHLADGVGLEKGFTLAVYPSFGGKDNPVMNGQGKGIRLDENGSYNRNLTIYCADSVYIGKNVMFGSNVLISDNEHGTDPSLDIPYREQPLVTKPVSIGDGCWVAEDAKILSGTKIGEKCIIAAGAVVKGVFPDRCVLAGVPARIVRTWSEKDHKWVKPE